MTPFQQPRPSDGTRAKIRVLVSTAKQYVHQLDEMERVERRTGRGVQDGHYEHLLLDRDELRAFYYEVELVAHEVLGSDPIPDVVWRPPYRQSSAVAPKDPREVLHGELETTLRFLQSLQADIEKLTMPLTATDPTTETPTAALERDKIFVVHGRNLGIRHAVCDFLRGLEKEPLVLAELPSGGRTLIEKFEHYATYATYAIILLTPDDIGGLKTSSDAQNRARQNVIFELGYFIGKFGRGHVCLMSTPDVELPSDLNGVVYVPIDEQNQWGWQLVHEFLHAQIALDVASVARSCKSLLSGT